MANLASEADYNGPKQPATNTYDLTDKSTMSNNILQMQRQLAAWVHFGKFASCDSEKRSCIKQHPEEL